MIRLNHDRLNKLKKKDMKEKVNQLQEIDREANKTIEDQISEIETSKMNKRELEWFSLAKEGLVSGSITRKRDGKLSKKEMVDLGKEIAHKREEKARKERAKQTLETKPDNFHILRDDSELPGFVNRLREECKKQREEWEDRWGVLGVESLMAWDYEGTGTDAYIDLSIGMSVWLPILDEGYYLPYGHVSGITEVNGVEIPYEMQHMPTDKQLTRSKVIEAVKPYMNAETEGKSFHMGSTLYDMHVALNDGYEIRGLRWDTRNAMYVLNEHEKTYALKPLTQKYGKFLGIEGDVFTFEDLFGNCSPAPFNIELVGIYAIKDVLYGWRLTEWQFEMMKKTDRLLDCYSQIDAHLPETDFLLVRSGFDLDFDGMKQLEEEFTQELKEARQELFKAYSIDDEFLRAMSIRLNGHKMKKWVEKQKERISKHDERMEKQKAIIRDCEAKGKTHLKKYANAVSQLKKYRETYPEPAEIEYAPHWIDEFSLTNNNHKAYLIYDHLGIEDVTPRIEPGKKRGTSTAVLKEYFKTETSLKPLKKVSELQKLLTTYVTVLPKNIEVDGKIHSRFDATGTATGRYSSSTYKGRPRELVDRLKKIAEGGG